MQSRRNWLIFLGVLLILLCCAAVAAVTTTAWLSYKNVLKQQSVARTPSGTHQVPTNSNTLPMTVLSPEPTITMMPIYTVVPTAGLTPEPAVLTFAEQTLLTLRSEVVPLSDRLDLARRLTGLQEIPALPLQAIPHHVGDEQLFWVNNVDDIRHFQVNAVLEYVTEHAYYWIESGVAFDEEALKTLAEAFENQIYPTTRAFFGSESTPGLDQDPHLYIIYARDMGDSVGGYFSSFDSIHPAAHEYSNNHELFYFNADATLLSDPYTYSILAHEFQHMILSNQDANEETWLNEGFSELSVVLNGYETGGFYYSFLRNPDLQLNSWPSQQSDSSANYGASFLFVNYVYDRFGVDFTQRLAHNPANGFQSLDGLLSGLSIPENVSDLGITSDAVFQDWSLANYLQDTSLDEGRYGYKTVLNLPQAEPTEEIRQCDSSWQERTVHQFGTDYIRIMCPGYTTLRFQGDASVGLIPEAPHSGQWMIWSNEGEEADMTLTGHFDFRDTPGPISLRYWTWYDIEEGYDYVYVLASEDGITWDILKPPHATTEDPSGNSFGWAYNGSSNTWIEEDVDLSDYAGKEIDLRFEYVTDAGVNGIGFALDDIRIPEIGYQTDFEQDEGKWQGEGFVRIQNVLPQSFALTIIQMNYTGVDIEKHLLTDGTEFIRKLNMDGNASEVVLVVSGLTRYTQQVARYQFNLR